jgi:hypothetical protein
MTYINRLTLKQRILVLSLLAAFLLASGAAAAQALPQAVAQRRAVVSAGFTSASTGPVSLHGTLGQPFVGLSQSGNIELRHGFWHGMQAGNKLYLPVVERNN